MVHLCSVQHEKDHAETMLRPSDYRRIWIWVHSWECPLYHQITTTTTEDDTLGRAGSVSVDQKREMVQRLKDLHDNVFEGNTEMPKSMPFQCYLQKHCHGPLGDFGQLCCWDNLQQWGRQQCKSLHRRRSSIYSLSSLNPMPKFATQSGGPCFKINWNPTLLKKAKDLSSKNFLVERILQWVLVFQLKLKAEINGWIQPRFNCYCTCTKISMVTLFQLQLLIFYQCKESQSDWAPCCCRDCKWDCGSRGYWSPFLWKMRSLLFFFLMSKKIKLKKK